MTDCLRQFILSINQLEIVKAEEKPTEKVNRYLNRMESEWRTGSAERRQSEEAFLKIVSGEKASGPRP